jgi:hypothetical protein
MVSRGTQTKLVALCASEGIRPNYCNASFPTEAIPRQMIPRPESIFLSPY